MLARYFCVLLFLPGGIIPAAAQLAAPSAIEVNLGPVYINQYTTTNPTINYLNCPAGSFFRQCYQAALAAYKADGVTGVRMQLEVCGGADASTALLNCGNEDFTQVTLSSAWVQKLNDFFFDIRQSGITKITPSLSLLIPFGTNPLNRTAEHRCYVQSDGSFEVRTLYFLPSVPFGFKQTVNPDTLEVGYDIDAQGVNNAYACAPRNPYFVGWNNMYSVASAILSTAKANSLIVSEFDMQNEINMEQFTVMARLIRDNQQEIGGPNTGDPNALEVVRGLMQTNSFDRNRVTWSVTEDRTDIPMFECGSVYGDSARVFKLSSLTAGIGGGLIGTPVVRPEDYNPYLVCGGNPADDSNRMFQMPVAFPQPALVDLHSYPCLQYDDTPNDPIPDHEEFGKCDLAQSADAVAVEGQTTFTALKRFLDSFDAGVNDDSHEEDLNLLNAQVYIGETHSKTSVARTLYDPPVSATVTCENSPVFAPEQTVAGFNQSTLAGRVIPSGQPGVIFRPWNFPFAFPGTTPCYPFPMDINPPYTPAP